MDFNFKGFFAASYDEPRGRGAGKAKSKAATKDSQPAAAKAKQSEGGAVVKAGGGKSGSPRDAYLAAVDSSNKKASSTPAPARGEQQARQVLKPAIFEQGSPSTPKMNQNSTAPASPGTTKVNSINNQGGARPPAGAPGPGGRKSPPVTQNVAGGRGPFLPPAPTAPKIIETVRPIQGFARGGDTRSKIRQAATAGKNQQQIASYADDWDQQQPKSELSSFFDNYWDEDVEADGGQTAKDKGSKEPNKRSGSPPQGANNRARTNSPENANTDDSTGMFNFLYALNGGGEDTPIQVQPKKITEKFKGQFSKTTAPAGPPSSSKAPSKAPLPASGAQQENQNAFYPAKRVLQPGAIKNFAGPSVMSKPGLTGTPGGDVDRNVKDLIEVTRLSNRSDLLLDEADLCNLNMEQRRSRTKNQNAYYNDAAAASATLTSATERDSTASTGRVGRYREKFAGGAGPPPRPPSGGIIKLERNNVQPWNNPQPVKDGQAARGRGRGPGRSGSSDVEPSSASSSRSSIDKRDVLGNRIVVTERPRDRSVGKGNAPAPQQKSAQENVFTTALNVAKNKAKSIKGKINSSRLRAKLQAEVKVQQLLTFTRAKKRAGGRGERADLHPQASSGTLAQHDHAPARQFSQPHNDSGGSRPAPGGSNQSLKMSGGGISNNGPTWCPATVRLHNRAPLHNSSDSIQPKALQHSGSNLNLSPGKQGVWVGSARSKELLRSGSSASQQSIRGAGDSKRGRTVSVAQLDGVGKTASIRLSTRAVAGPGAEENDHSTFLRTRSGSSSTPAPGSPRLFAPNPKAVARPKQGAKRTAYLQENHIRIRFLDGVDPGTEIMPSLSAPNLAEVVEPEDPSTVYDELVAKVEELLLQQYEDVIKKKPYTTQYLKQFSEFVYRTKLFLRLLGTDCGEFEKQRFRLQDAEIWRQLVRAPDHQKLFEGILGKNVDVTTFLSIYLDIDLSKTLVDALVKLEDQDYLQGKAKVVVKLTPEQRRLACGAASEESAVIKEQAAQLATAHPQLQPPTDSLDRQFWFCLLCEEKHKPGRDFMFCSKCGTHYENTDLYLCGAGMSGNNCNCVLRYDCPFGIPQCPDCGMLRTNWMKIWERWKVDNALYEDASASIDLDEAEMREKGISRETLMQQRLQLAMNTEVNKTPRPEEPGGGEGSNGGSPRTGGTTTNNPGDRLSLSMFDSLGSAENSLLRNMLVVDAGGGDIDGDDLSDVEFLEIDE
ncbi:unnamed protein product [Amoebophrya sp. A120]|nr:unnamed protein product [Amoebophrya sp. A120]|eukprot:GSA120T00004359001.1